MPEDGKSLPAKLKKETDDQLGDFHIETEMTVCLDILKPDFKNSTHLQGRLGWDTYRTYLYNFIALLHLPRLQTAVSESDLQVIQFTDSSVAGILVTCGYTLPSLSKKPLLYKLLIQAQIQVLLL